MKRQRTTPSFRATVLEHFDHRRGLGSDGDVHHVTYLLMAMILEHRDFSEIESLVSFCNIPDNLRWCLPNEVDRIIFCNQLTTTLREMVSSPSEAVHF